MRCSPGADRRKTFATKETSEIDEATDDAAIAYKHRDVCEHCRSGDCFDGSHLLLGLGKGHARRAVVGTHPGGH
jgi:hypothetical protein